MAHCVEVRGWHTDVEVAVTVDVATAVALE
jgi:hypothetical protein